MIMPHQSDEICEKLLAIKEIFEEIEEIVELD